MLDSSLPDAGPSARPVTRPGDLIRSHLEGLGWTQEDLARILGRAPKTINQILTGKTGITIQTAQELAAALGETPEYWLNLDARSRLAESRVAATEIQRKARLFSSAPVKEMERRGWIKQTTDAHELEQELRRFYAEDSLEDGPMLRAAARQSVSDSALSAAQVAWCYRAVQLSRSVQAADYDKRRIVAALPKLRAFAAHPDSARNVPRWLAEHGVKLLVIEHLPRTRMDGAALMVEGNPIIALSLRFDRMDSFWHTLLHEVSHIVHEDGEAMLDSDLSDNTDDDWQVRPEIEKRANEEAAETLIPRDLMDAFILRVKPLYSKARINQFANRIKIHPAVIVGQLQHRGELSYGWGREYLVKIREHVVGVAMTDGFGHRPEGV